MVSPFVLLFLLYREISDLSMGKVHKKTAPAVVSAVWKRKPRSIEDGRDKDLIGQAVQGILWGCERKK